ncbi:MAG: hypothetical protein QNJ31_00305 [Candidatus Caenarcaniphilales bacterium]|nr:hypothetical protein [Candidatus Caenarcaniphilales bacterium]
MSNLSQLGQKAAQVFSVEPNGFLKKNGYRSINLKNLKTLLEQESKKLIKTALIDKYKDTLSGQDLKNKIQEEYQKTDDSQIDKYEIAAEAVQEFITSQKFGSDNEVEASEMKDLFLAIQEIDDDKDNIALPETKLDPFVSNTSSPEDIARYKEQAIFSALIRQSDHITDVNRSYNGALTSNTDLNGLDNARLNVSVKVSEDQQKETFRRSSSIDSAEFLLEYNSGLEALRKKGIQGTSPDEYVRFFVDMARKIPFSENNIRVLVNDFIGNLQGTIMLRDPNDPIYSTWYLPFASQQLKTINLLFASIISDEIQLEARNVSSRTLLREVSNDNKSVEFLMEGDPKKKFDAEIFLGGENNQNNLPQPLKDLRNYIIGQAKSNNEYSWADAQRDAISFDKKNNNSIGLAKAIAEDKVAYNLITFREVASVQLDSKIKNLDSKLNAAKALNDYIQKGFKQPQLGNQSS